MGKPLVLDGAMTTMKTRTLILTATLLSCSKTPDPPSEGSETETTAMPTTGEGDVGSRCDEKADCIWSATHLAGRCDFLDGMCGEGVKGYCIEGIDYPLSWVCEDLLGEGGPSERPTCGCDGKVYETSCFVAAADQSKTVGCEIPEGHFRCGWSFCRLGEDYCQQGTRESRFGETLPTYHCKSLPEACEIEPSCTCLGATCESCHADADGSLQCDVGHAMDD